MFLVSFDRSEVCTHGERVRLLFYFVPNLSIFVSRRRELTLLVDLGY
jgi:hypothetical protein